MPYSHILFQVEESGIALLTVNRPQKLNALSSAVIAELADAFGRVAGDPAIRAAIVTGAGEKAFVAGADIGELAALSARAQGKGLQPSVIDGLVAATALEHDLTLVTRNVRDFEQLGVALFNPWTS